MEVGGLGRAHPFILWILGIFSFCNTWLLIPAIPSFLSLFGSANTAFKQRNQKEVLNLQCLLPSGVSRPCCPGQIGACGIPCTWKGDLKRAGQELDPVQLILTCQGQDSWFVNDWGGEVAEMSEAERR